MRINFFVTFLFMTSSVDLPGGGSGRTIADIRRLESAAPPSHIATFLYGLRYLLGRVFGWDREPMPPEDSLLKRPSPRDRCDSEITPGTLDGHFWILYQLPGKALRETRNKTVHGFICGALVSSPNRVHFVLGGLCQPRVVAYATVPRCDRTISPRSVSSDASPHSSRVDRCLRRMSRNDQPNVV